MTDHDDRRGAGGARRWLRPLARWGLLALAVALVAHLLAGLEWGELAARLAGARRPWIALALVLLLARFVVWAWRWRLAVVRLEPRGAPPLAALYWMVMASAVLNHITPTARLIGGVMRARYLARATGGPGGRAFGGVLFDQLVHQATMAAVTVLGLVAALFATGRQRAAGWSLVAVAGGAAAAAGLWLVWRTRGGAGLERLARRLAERAGGDGPARRAFAHGREAVDALSALLEDGRLIAAMVALGALYSVINAGCQWAIFRGLDQQPGLLVVLAAVSLGMAAGAVAGTPGGIGATEAAMIGAFVLFGIDRVDATAAALLYRGLHYLTVLAVGTPALVWLEARQRATPPPAPSNHHSPDERHR